MKSSVDLVRDFIEETGLQSRIPEWEDLDKKHTLDVGDNVFFSLCAFLLCFVLNIVFFTTLRLGLPETTCSIVATICSLVMAVVLVALILRFVRTNKEYRSKVAKMESDIANSYEHSNKVVPLHYAKNSLQILCLLENGSATSVSDAIRLL